MRTLILGTLFMAAAVYGECRYDQGGNAKVTWKAFKTYEKIGVGGSFDRTLFKSVSSPTADAFLNGSTITIDTLSVNSGNAGRDATLSSSFFKVQDVNTISGTIKSAKEGKALVEIAMNGIVKTIPMTYSSTDDKIVGKGVIDLNDFGMLPSLASLNKACFDLHAGKTWQDVEISFEIPLRKNCS